MALVSSNTMVLIIALGALAIGIVLGYLLRKRISGKILESSETLSVRIVDEAKKEADTIKKEAILQAKDNLLKTKAEIENETREKKAEFDNLEKRLRSKEESLDKRMDLLVQKETNIEKREKGLINKESQLDEKHGELNKIIEEQRMRLEKIAGVSSEEAKKLPHPIDEG